MAQFAFQLDYRDSSVEMVHLGASQGVAAGKSESPLVPAIFFFSGATAGAAEGLVTYPFEFAKTSVQLRNSYTSNNPLKVVSQIISRQGLGAVYTGCASLVLGNMAKDGVRFFAYDAIRIKLAGPSGHAGVFQGLLAGMCAGFAESVLAVTPSERIKTALIDDARSGAGKLRGMGDAIHQIVRSRGLQGLYTGLLPTTMKQASTSAVRMGSYNMLKEFGQAKGIQHNAATTFLMGCMAGTITVYTTQPFDSIKTRSQALGSAGTWQSFQNILQDHGVGGLWKGSTMRLGRLFLGGGIVFSVYEQTRGALEFLLL